MVNVVCGIDPGGRSTGFAVVRGGELLGWALVERKTDYRAALRETIAGFRLQHAWSPDVWAIEGLTHPNPHMGLTNVSGLIETARVIGWLEIWLEPSTAVQIDPGGHGSGPLAAYPPELVGVRETKGAGKLRHVRSAYDVALAASQGHT